jgi:hypothetical protein
VTVRVGVVGPQFPDPFVGNITDSIRRHPMFVASSDLVRFNDALLTQWSAKMLRLPFFHIFPACYRKWYGWPGHCGVEPAIGAFGNMYESVRVLERLAKAGLPSPLHAPYVASGPTHSSWPRARSGAAVLNSCQPCDMEGFNWRLSEAVDGALVLTGFRPELPELFEPSAQISVVASFDDLVVQAKGLLIDQYRDRR